MPPELLALPFGLAIGLALGLVGAGGSLLTVPVLVYVLGMDVKAATTATLIIVGLAAAVGATGYARRGLVERRVAVWFGAAAALGSVGGTALNRLVDDDVLLLAFGTLMLVAAAALLRGRPEEPGQAPVALSARAIAAGLGVGVLTGFLGVGGGFVIVPVLILGLHLPTRMAVGTSLVVITIASAVALAGHLSTGPIEWGVTAAFTAAAMIGTLLAARLIGRIPPLVLNRAFTVLVTGVGVVVIVRAVSALV